MAVRALELFTDLPAFPEALCQDEDPELFYPEERGAPDLSPTKEVCNGVPGLTLPCPERERCLEWALEHDLEWGVWGGLSPYERRRFLSARTGQPIRSRRFG